MNCATSKKFIDAYMDGELEAGMMLELDTHIESCKPCNGLYQVKKQMKSELLQLSKVKAPLHLRSQIEALSQGKSIHWWRKTAITMPIAAAAAVMLLFWSGGREDVPNHAEQMALVVDDVVEKHVRELPMEIKDDNQNTAASWFRGKIDFPVKTLGPGIKNATFEGARVSNVRERQAAQMVYNVEGKKVTLMVFPANQLSISGGSIWTVKGKQILTGRRNGYNVAMAKEGDMIYAVSSDLPIKRLVSLLVEGNKKVY